MTVDPHEWHQLVDGPIRIQATRDNWYGTCQCGHPFKGISRQDIYMKAQAHINQHTDYDGGDIA